MMLGKDAIEEAFNSGLWKAWVDGKEVKTDPLPPTFKNAIGPNSIDVTLGKWIYETTFRKATVDPMDNDTNPWQDEPREMCEPYTINPGECILACTRERFDCSNMLWIPDTGYWSYWKPDIDGRSTVGRLFLAVHMTAGFGDYDFQGAFTLEIKNLFDRPILLYPEMRIAQVFFNEVHEPGRYKGAYSHEDHYSKPVKPVLGKDRFF